MNAQEQVVSLKLAKALKEAGYKQEGLWWWVSRFRQDVPEQEEYYCVETIGIPYRDSRSPQEIVCVAPTVAELGKALPRYVNYNNIKKLWVNIVKNNRDTIHTVEDNTEADARAKMWLLLKKEGLL